MTTRWPSVVSSLSKRHGGIRLNNHPQSIPILSITKTNTIRQYSTPFEGPPEQKQDDLNRPEKSALIEIQGLRPIDALSPPRSTLPPSLNLPSRGDLNIALYYYRIGRAYGSFYFSGIKAVWFNYQAVKLLKQRLQAKGGNQLDNLKRSEFQLLARNRHDISKLPFFGLLVAVFGEWLPLLVPFIPSAVPGTCRIPKQIRGMRAKAEERRRVSFRRGVSEPIVGEIAAAASDAWAMTERKVAGEVLLKLKDEQLYHLSCNLNNHNNLWDRVQLPPLSVLLRRGLSKRLAYITADDKLLTRIDKAAEKLTSDELAIACEERGIDVLGKRDETLRKELTFWLERQKADRGSAKTLMVLLFRRPNAWATKV